MPKDILTPEEGAELKRLYDEHRDATVSAAGVLASHGMDSPEFSEADKRTTLTWSRIRDFLGTSASHWMET